MYSSEITERHLSLARKKGFEFQRHPRDLSLEISRKLQSLRTDARGNSLPPGQLTRPLDARESEFIASEQLLCKFDFEYYLSRYHAVERDPGVGAGEGIGSCKLLESQRRFLRALARREKEVHAEWTKYKHTEGIRVLAHKCRQVAFTSLSRALTLHRMIFWPGTRAFAGTLEPDGCGELYKRDKLTLENLPFWLGPPSLYPDVKDQEMGFPPPFSSRIRYQPENQKTGIGVGTQIDVSHLTEVPLWKYPFQIGYSFAPALPKGRLTLHIQEGTACGKGYWYEVTEACRKKLKGYESWTYVFVPWYLNRLKYRANAPEDWTPEDHTLAHADLIERTSPEFCDGTRIEPSRDQLYWWELERARFARDDKLASFLSNYPATPEQSFTNWAQGALPVELIEQMELEARIPNGFDIEVAA